MPSLRNPVLTILSRRATFEMDEVKCQMFPHIKQQKCSGNRNKNTCEKLKKKYTALVTQNVPLSSLFPNTLPSTVTAWTPEQTSSFPPFSAASDPHIQCHPNPSHERTRQHTPNTHVWLRPPPGPFFGMASPKREVSMMDVWLVALP